MTFATHTNLIPVFLKENLILNEVVSPTSDNLVVGTESLIPLSLIQGVHPVIESLYEKLSIPPLRAIPLKAMRHDDLMILLTLHPIRVCRFKNRLRCSGNVRMLQLAQRILPHQNNVPCIKELPPSEAQLTQRALIEYLVGPAYLGYHFSDIKILTDVARRAIENGGIKIDDPNIESWMAKLYGVDKRQLKPKPDTC